MQMDKIDTEEIVYRVFKGVKLYEVGNERVIRGEKGIFCSCNESYCWHIFKVVFDFLILQIKIHV